MNFDSLPDGALPDLRLRGEVGLGPPGGTARDLRMPGADHRVAATRHRATSCSALTTCLAVATGRGSTSDSMPRQARNIVEVNPLPGILPNPADNSCFPKAARAAGLSYDELIQARSSPRDGRASRLDRHRSCRVAAAGSGPQPDGVANEGRHSLRWRLGASGQSRICSSSSTVEAVERSLVRRWHDRRASR